MNGLPDSYRTQGPDGIEAPDCEICKQGMYTDYDVSDDGSLVFYCVNPRCPECPHYEELDPSEIEVTFQYFRAKYTARETSNG